jgi:hypothetical protein
VKIGLDLTCVFRVIGLSLSFVHLATCEAPWAAALTPASAETRCSIVVRSLGLDCEVGRVGANRVATQV